MARETLVMLPGMMSNERLFAPQTEALEEDYDIVVPALSKPTIEAMAQWVLNSVPVKSFNLMGLSMGGIVAMDIIRQAPERVDRLALLDTNHFADAVDRYDLRNRQIEDVELGKLRDVIVEEMKPVYLAKKNRSNQALLNILIDMAIDVGPEAFIAQSLALRDRKDQSTALSQYDGPSLVLCGEEDLLCPPERHFKIAELLADATLKIVANAGHITTLEDPEAVNLALQNWLATPLPKS